jgi:protein-S-isoprenylcysteine O-methyltransferase Ste14
MILALRSIFFALLLPGNVAGAIPALLVWWGEGEFDIGSFRFIGSFPFAVGLIGLVWCIVDFARIGRGTLATVDPPTVFVSRGLYRYVRNPMYVSVFLILLGETLLFQNWMIGAWGAVAVTGFHLFVILWEEPHLRGRFGNAYERYLRTVPRWIPRFTAGEGESGSPTSRSCPSPGG